MFYNNAVSTAEAFVIKLYERIMYLERGRKWQLLFQGSVLAFHWRDWEKP
jgi:hypothetical protein